MRNRTHSVIVKWIYGMLSGIVMAQAVGISSLSSFLFTAIMALTVCLWLSTAAVRISRTSSLALVTVLISAVNVLINAVINRDLFVLQDMKKLIIFAVAILFFAAMCDYRADRSVIWTVFHINTVTGFFLLLMYVVRNQRMYLYNSQVTQYLTFGFNNPNLTAAFLLCNCMVEAIQVFYHRKRIKQGLHLALSIVIAGFLLETKARNCLLAICVFLVVYLPVLVLRRRPLQMKKWMSAAIAVFPAVFAAVYMLVIQHPFFRRITGFLVSEGKNIDSRASIWKFALDMIWKSPVIGAYTQALHGTSQSHMHNSHLDVLASYGTVVFALFCVFLYRVLVCAGRQKPGTIQQLSLWAFAAALLVGMGEAMLFSGGLGIYAYAAVFLLIANHDFEDVEK